MTIDSIIAVVCQPRWDLAARTAWRATVKRGALPPTIDDAWFQWLIQLTDHAESRRACAEMAEKLHRHDDLVVCWSMLAIDPQDPVGLTDLLMAIGTAVRAVDFNDSPELRARLNVMRAVARGEHAGEFGSLWHLVSTHRKKHQDDEPLFVSGISHPVELLGYELWNIAFSWLIDQTERHFKRCEREIPDVVRDASDRRAWAKSARTFSDDLFMIGHEWSGELALAWRMMTCDPKDPQSFIDVLPAVDWMIKHHSIITSQQQKALFNARLQIWWRAAAGEWVGDDVSIFRIAFCETESLEFEEPVVADNDVFASMRPGTPKKYAGPSIVVMNGKLAEERGLPTAWKDLRNKALPLVVANDVARIRSTLYAEYPHSTAAVDLLTRDLREGQPVRMQPTLLVGTPGSGKSRMVRRLADLLRIYVYRHDGAASHDATYAGAPKAWSTAQPSVPARAIMMSQTANPIVMVDEIEKGGTSSYNGNLWNSMTPFLERETAARYRENGLDAELDLSHVNHIATANGVEPLPAPLRDRFRVVRIPAPTLAHLPALAAQMMRDLVLDDEARSYDEPLAHDELGVIGRAWAREKFSMRKLQRLVAATLEARDQCAMRH